MLLLLFVLLFCVSLPGCKTKDKLRLATTTSTRDSGLLDELLPIFEKRNDVRVDVIAVGTGKALKIAEAGDVDVVMVHARTAEDAFMAAKHGSRREDVMYNRFELLGPPTDPAKIAGRTPLEALSAIATKKQTFVSRGDDSGTHKKERSLWKLAGGLVPWADYIETGQGMGNTLVIANEKRAYLLADRGTYLSFKKKIALLPLAKQDPVMHNPYGVMVVNPEQHSHVNKKRAHALVDFLISAEGQRMISAFRIEGEQLFHPTGRTRTSSRSEPKPPSQ